MVFWSLYQNKSMEFIQQMYCPPGVNGKAIYEKQNAHIFYSSRSLFVSFSFIPQGKLVCCNAVDLLGDEKSPGSSTVTGLKWTLCS